MRSFRVWVIVYVMLFISIVVPAQIYADTVSFNSTIDRTGTLLGNVGGAGNYLVPKFDPTLGTLKKVTLDFSQSVSVAGTLTLDGICPGNQCVNISVLQSVTAVYVPDTGDIFAVGGSFDKGPSDASGGVISIGYSAPGIHESREYTNAAYLFYFVEGNSSSVVGAISNYSIYRNALWGIPDLTYSVVGDFHVTYEYDSKVVPEPASMLLLGLGLIGLVVVRRVQ